MVIAVWDAGGHAALLQEVLQRQAVHHRAEHAHVVRARSGRGRALLQFGTAEEVAATDDDGDLRTGRHDLGNLVGHRGDDIGVRPTSPPPNISPPSFSRTR